VWAAPRRGCITTIGPQAVSIADDVSIRTLSAEEPSVLEIKSMYLKPPADRHQATMFAAGTSFLTPGRALTG